MDVYGSFHVARVIIFIVSITIVLMITFFAPFNQITFCSSWRNMHISKVEIGKRVTGFFHGTKYFVGRRSLFLSFPDSLLFPRIPGAKILELFLCSRTLNCKENTCLSKIKVSTFCLILNSLSRCSHYGIIM